MDAADAYVELYDILVRCDLPHLSDWSVTQDVQDIADQIRSEVEAQGELPDQLWNTWLPGGPACTAQALGVLLGLDRALLNADRARDTLANRALGHLRARSILRSAMRTPPAPSAGPCPASPRNSAPGSHWPRRRRPPSGGTPAPAAPRALGEGIGLRSRAARNLTAPAAHHQARHRRGQVDPVHAVDLQQSASIHHIADRDRVSSRQT
jgi:hypothetical protein